MILGAAAGRGPSPLRLLAACLALGCVVAGTPPPAAARSSPGPTSRSTTGSSPRPPLRAPSGRVALVEVDERSLAEAGRWPWPRDRVAGLLDRVRALGARSRSAWTSSSRSPTRAARRPAAPGRRRPPLSARDAALAAALGRGPFVIGYAFTFDRPVDRPCHLRSIGLARAATGGGLTQVPRAAGVLCSLEPARRGGRLVAAS